ncbi:MAG: GntR family transcriptional regulator [Fimbriiglobus sp.]
MRLRILPDSTVPIYEQILSQVVFVVAAGDVSPGDFVPSVRDLSQQLIVNANTVTRAYQELERLGILESRRGIGMAVTPEAPKLCRDQRKFIVRERVREMIREAASAGFSSLELQQLVTEEWPSATRNGTSKTNR